MQYILNLRKEYVIDKHIKKSQHKIDKKFIEEQ